MILAIFEKNLLRYICRELLDQLIFYKYFKMFNINSH